MTRLNTDSDAYVPLTRATEDWADAELEAEFARLNPEIQRRVALRVLEIDALKREVDAQMQAKLDAQSLLANLCEALGFDRSDFDLSDTWRTVGPRLVDRISEMVLQNERLVTDFVALERERDAIGAALGEPCAECGHIDWRSDGYAESLQERVAKEYAAVENEEHRQQVAAEGRKESYPEACPFCGCLTYRLVNTSLHMDAPDGAVLCTNCGKGWVHSSDEKGLLR